MSYKNEDSLFSSTRLKEDIDNLEQVLFDKPHIALLIIVGGHVGGLEINSRACINGHLLLIQSIDLISKEILVLTNKYSADNMKTIRFSDRIKTAFDSSNTLLF
jgi:hypothetical protein